MIDNKENQPDLPILSKKEEIISAISKNRVVIISGETGSGKTTQIPMFCLEAKRGIKKIIGCTQPRRIAAIYVAKKIANQLGEDIGKSVGFKIRFTDKTSPDTRIKIMTDGILLAEANNDRLLRKYDTIIVDEAHERSINIDFVLGILKKLLKKRKNLKIVITSATIDTKKFSRAFDNAPVIKVSGRMFPVETRYVSEKKEPDENYVDTAVRTVIELTEEKKSGDMLVFMPTERDISDTCEILEKKIGNKALILPLYARLSGKKQAYVFASSPKRKIIVATNIAETSITIPNITYVVDTGLARIAEYNPGSRMSSLPVSPISKSSADQRKGRCGRVQNGICVRLYQKENYDNRPLFTLPEILRTNLADVVLRMLYLKLGDISEFPFIDMPDKKSVRDGFSLLSELGAIKENENKEWLLTEKGRLMAKMPIDPRLSRVIIKASQLGCLKEILIIVSALSIRDPRERPIEKIESADVAHKKFQDSQSDFVSFVNIWRQYHLAEKKGKTKSRKRKLGKEFCMKNFLSFKRMYEWRDVYGQIESVLKENKIKNTLLKEEEEKNVRFNQLYSSIHKSIICGFVSNIGMKKDKNIYNAANDKEAMIFPGSALFDNASDWIIAGELVKTSRLFARIVANIDENWIEDLFGDRCKYTYYDPHWEKKRGEVTAFEQVTLFGLTIIKKRRVSFGRIDPEKASEIFIQSGLIYKETKENFGFLKHNAKLEKSVKDMENRLRKKGILVSEKAIFDFYRKRINGIYDIRSLKRLIRKKRGDKFLMMKEDDLLEYMPDKNDLSQFPEWLNINGERLKCKYEFDIENEADGVTLEIPANKVSSLNPHQTDWVVPGFFPEKIIAMIKSLPKEERKKLMPASYYAEIISSEIIQEEKPLASALSGFIYDRFGIDIPASAWRQETIPSHLQMRFLILDSKGKEVAASRSKLILNAHIKKAENPDEFVSTKTRWETEHNEKIYDSWEFGEIAESVTITGSKGKIWKVYPALKPMEDKKKQGVKISLFLDKREAFQMNKKGVAELYKILLASDLKFLKKSISRKASDIDAQTFHFGGKKKFSDKIYESVISDFLYKNIKKKEAFSSYLTELKKNILQSGLKKLDACIDAVMIFHKVAIRISSYENSYKKNDTLFSFLDFLKKEFFAIIPENFLELYDTARISNLPRYIKTYGIRAEKGVENYSDYLKKNEKIAKYKSSLGSFVSDITESISDEKRFAIEDFLWAVEEYKVSIFAQNLKTSFPVSEKRLDKMIEEIGRMV